MEDIIKIMEKLQSINITLSVKFIFVQNKTRQNKTKKQAFED